MSHLAKNSMSIIINYQQDHCKQPKAVFFVAKRFNTLYCFGEASKIVLIYVDNMTVGESVK